MTAPRPTATMSKSVRLRKYRRRVWRVRHTVALRNGSLWPHVLVVPLSGYPTEVKAVAKVKRVIKKLLPDCIVTLQSCTLVWIGCFREQDEGT